MSGWLPSQSGPITQPCGCVNHIGGEITYCRMHGAAEEIARTLRETVVAHCPSDAMFCSTCTPARALLARLDTP